MEELIKNIRKENLLRLLAGFPKEKEFAFRAGLEPSYLSRIKGNQPIGGKVARQIEHAAGKPYLWLDTSHPAELAIPETPELLVREKLAEYEVDSLMAELVNLIKEMPEGKKLALLELLKK